MSLAQKLMGGGHGHDDHGGELIVRPRLYERGAGMLFLGRRRRTYDRLVALAGIGPGDRVLDIGCGTGYLTRRAAKATGHTGRVVGIDPSEPVIGYARRVSPPWCAYQVTGADRIDEPDETFDVAVSSLAMHHIPAERRTDSLREIRRLVRPGGRLLIADFGQPRGGFASVLGRIIGHGMRHNPVGHLPAMIAEAGFSVTGTGYLWPLLSYVVAERR